MTDYPQSPSQDPEDRDGRTTNDLAKEAMEAMRMLQEKLRQEQAVQASAGLVTETTRLRFDVGGFSAPLIVTVVAEVTIGRSDSVANYTPEVDLTPYGAYRLGISRRHAIIRRQMGALYVIDLGSRNGTLLNGVKLEPQLPTILRDGDEILLGNLTLRLSFLSDEGER
jgi:hypothetical protein